MDIETDNNSISFSGPKRLQEKYDNYVNHL